MILIWQLALVVQPNLGTHPGEVEQAVGLLETSFDSFNLHRGGLADVIQGGLPLELSAPVITASMR